LDATADALAAPLLSETLSPEPVEPVEAAGETGGYVLWPRLALLGMSCMCGSNFPILKLLEESHSEGSVALVRFGLATLPFLGSLNTAPAVALAGVELGTWASLGYITQAVGLHLTDAAKGAFICCLFAVVAPLASSAGLAGPKAKAAGTPPAVWAAVALALAGTALLELGDASDLSEAFAEVNAGDVWCLGAATGFGMMFARMARHMEDKDGQVVEMTAWQLVTLTVANALWFVLDDLHGLLGIEHSTGLGGPELEAATAAYAAAEVAEWGEPGVSELVRWSFGEVGLLVWIGLCTTSLVLWGQTKMMSKVSASETGIIFSTEPLFAALFAFAILHEAPPGPTEAAGAALILGGCVLSATAEQD